MQLMKKLAAFFLCCAIALPANAKPVVTPVKKGDPSPSNGVHMNVEAAAKTKAEIEFSRAECRLEADKERQLREARHKYEIAIVKAQKEAIEQQSKDRLMIKTGQIEQLQDTVKKQTIARERQRRVTTILVAGGVLTGVALTLVAGFALGAASK